MHWWAVYPEMRLRNPKLQQGTQAIRSFPTRSVVFLSCRLLSLLLLFNCSFKKSPRASRQQYKERLRGGKRYYSQTYVFSNNQQAKCIVRNSQSDPRVNPDTYRFKNADGLFAEPHGIQDVIMENRLKKVILIISFKRRLASHHLIHQHTQSPPVHRRAVLKLLQDLRTTKLHKSKV